MLSGRIYHTQFKFVSKSEVSLCLGQGLLAFFILQNCTHIENEHWCHSLFLCLNAKKEGRKTPDTNKNCNITHAKGDFMKPTEEIKKLVSYLNEQRHAYYNENSPHISDAEYAPNMECNPDLTISEL